MKLARQVPLFLGFGVFVLAVLISAVKVGQNNTLSDTRSQAAGSTSSLSLSYISPNQINVLVHSPVPISGIDAAIIFPSNIISVMPSTLIGSALFDVTGGSVDNKNGLFLFSGIAKNENVTKGVIASFQVEGGSDGSEIELSIDEQNSAIISKNTSQNILDTGGNVTFTLEQE